MQTVTHNKTLATAIPQELRDRKQWLRWGYRDREQTQKIPLYVNGTWAKTNAPDSFHSFDDVNQCDRVAYVIQGDDPYTGIDLDGCLDADGHMVDWARPIVERLCRVGYAEVSPSGRGIKILTRAKKPEGSRCVNKMGEGKQQLEVYDFNRFWTVTGDVYMMADEISDGQAEIDWLCNEYLQQDSIRTQDNVTYTVDPRGNLWGFNADDYEPYCAEDHETLQYEFHPSLKLQRRAESYLAAADRPGTGNRNNAAFGLAGHLRAIDEHGERLTEEQITQYMMQWNASLPEPLGERELLAAVRSSRCNGTRRAPKEAQETSGDWDPDRLLVKQYQAEQRAMMEEIIDEDAEATEHRFTLDHLPDETACQVTRAVRDWAAANYPGSALDEILAHCYASRWTSYEAPCLATAIGALSSLASWNYRSASADPNLYVVLTGATSTGKNMPVQIVPEILRACGAGHRLMPIPASSQKFNDGFLDNSALTLTWDEMGAGIQARDKSFQLGFLETINTAYTSARSPHVPLPTAKADSVERVAIYPHPTIVASSTPSELVSALGTAGSSGLLTRLINLHLRSEDEKSISRAQLADFIKHGTPKLPESLIAQCRRILHRAAAPIPSSPLADHYDDPARAGVEMVNDKPKRLPISPKGYQGDQGYCGVTITETTAAMEYMLDIAEEMNNAKRSSEERREVLARFAQNVAKVSLVLAVGVHSTEISLPMVQLAVRIVSASCLASGANWTLAGETELEKARGRVLRRLMDAGADGVPWRILKKSCTKTVTMRGQIMDAMLDSGEVRQARVGRQLHAVAPRWLREFKKRHPDAIIAQFQG